MKSMASGETSSTTPQSIVFFFNHRSTTTQIPILFSQLTNAMEINATPPIGIHTHFPRRKHKTRISAIPLQK